MSISLVVAKSKNNVIGKDNKLPWHLPADLQHFKNITINKSIIMGRKTFESIGKPLPNRRNIIISRNRHFIASGCEIFSSIDNALNAAKKESEIMIIGGENIFAQTIDRADRIYLTVIDAEFDGDTFFPELNKHWKLKSEEKFLSNENNKYAYCFQMWTKS
ncbi:MAG TPA: dihydrofolate reductase [Coxiellaceae bacterium]|nr:MAG: hypothetical protein A3E81_04430 [Gammaproteobacteria bacterium RIFCSPHIGHO2_12_FULL_36_30]HLB55997.1 dihydrofolate reductase [Coxiellaceae bacterium]